MIHPRKLKIRNPRLDTVDESGQAMMELAICLPLFVLLVLGGAEIANIAWASVQVHNAARAGAQYGSQSRANAASVTDIETAAKAEAPTLTITFPTAPSQSCSCVDPSTGSAPTSGSTGCDTLVECPSPYIILDNITVTTSAVVPPIIHYPGLPASFTLQATATMGVIK